MKRFFFLCMFLGILFLCCSCKGHQEKPEVVLPKEDEPEKIILEDEHSNLYLEDYSVDDVLKYFHEVVLNTEYSTGTGDSTLVQRWDIPICYEIVGDYTDEDVAVLEELFTNLNQMEGFPGVAPAKEDEAPNLYLYFEGREAFNDRFLDFIQNEYADGAARYWYYTDTNDIYEGMIGYWKDMPTEVRKSVLLEEVVNCLGLGDSTLREDSIIYQYSSDATDLSEMDWLILKLLYHPKIRCGMGAPECEEMIRELYY